MIEERIVVSDSNIFFDLLSVDLLNDFFLLPCEITTTDFVISEIIRPEQLDKLQSFIDSKKLDVINFINDEINKIFSIFSRMTTMLLLLIVQCGITPRKLMEDCLQATIN